MKELGTKFCEPEEMYHTNKDFKQKKEKIFFSYTEFRTKFYKYNIQYTFQIHLQNAFLSNWK